MATARIARALESNSACRLLLQGDVGAGKTIVAAYALLAAVGRHAQAALYYEQLEKEAPQSSLADDARLGAALSHYELGAESRFTEAGRGAENEAFFRV